VTYPRTPGREKFDGTAEQGYLHCGPNGAGILSKWSTTVSSTASWPLTLRGWHIARPPTWASNSIAIDAETTPLRDPGHYQYDLICVKHRRGFWRRGSVIASWLLDLTAAGLVNDPGSRSYWRVSDSGEGRWTIKALSTRPCRHPFSPQRSTSASRRAVRPTIRTKLSQRCATASADTWRKQPVNNRARKEILR